MILNRRAPAKRLAIGASAAVIGFATVGGGLALATGSGSGGEATIQALPGANRPAPAWPTNAQGQTYGSLLQSTSSATDPVLASVIATNGVSGYVYSSQLQPPLPSSPAAALAQQAANTAGQYIPVYAQNGTTVIGQFEVTEPSAQASGDTSAGAAARRAAAEQQAAASAG